MNDFKYEKTKIFYVPKDWKKIDAEAFFNNQQIRKVVIGENIQDIGNGSFVNCGYLQEVVLPDGLKKIPRSAFDDCRMLRTINLPKNLEVIDVQAFDSCISLTSIDLPEGLKRINAFAFCSSGLKEIKLPNSLRHIGDCAFSECNFDKVEIPENILDLGEETFYYCQELKYVDLGKNVNSIGERCFANCSELSNIQLSDSLTEIADAAFGACYKLSEVKFPDGLKVIEKAAFAKSGLKVFHAPKELKTLGFGVFSNCISLEKVELNEKLENISESCFMGCVGLNQIIIPKNIKNIKQDAFLYCKSLKQVTLEEGVQTIEARAFCGCKRLTKIKLPQSVKYVGDMAFGGCEKLEEIIIPKNCDFKGRLPFKPAYITYENGEFTITKQKRKGAFKCTEDMVGLTLANYEAKENLYKQMQDPAFRDLYEAMFYILSKDKFDEFFKTKNLKFYKRLYQACNVGAMDKELLPNMYKFLYNMGAFEGKRVVEVTTKSGTKKIEVFPAQKVCEYFINLNYNFHLLASGCFGDMEVEGYKHEFTEFALTGNNFERMLAYEDGKSKDFFAKCYNEFEAVQRTNTSNKGSQRQLKPKIEKFDTYFKTNKFNGVTQETEKLAMTISPYFSKQTTFDRAMGILKEFNSEKVQESIVDLEKYKVIDECALKIASLAEDALKQIKSTAELINYEWLKKNDERIFILGKLCGCCAHAEGQGYGIMRASIIHPNVQNLVVKHGNLIIAKATMYVNPQNGYAVINTVSLREEYKKHAGLVYKKLSEGVKAFTKAYNESHEEKIKIVTVGMNLNGIEKEIRRNNNKSDTLYESLNYGKYGMSGARYMGDSSDEQYIIWEEQNGKEK